MRVMRLDNSGAIYTSNSWFIRGDWNRIGDITTMIDTGRDPAVLNSVQQVYTGLGKRKVDLIVLTHSHYDHVEMLDELRRLYAPEVVGLEGGCVPVDRTLKDGDTLRMGDADWDVIAACAHTQDSLCLYNEASGALFSGDAPLLIQSPGGSYEPGFEHVLERLSQRQVGAIYPGHGDAVTDACNARLRMSLDFVRASLQPVRPKD